MSSDLLKDNKKYSKLEREFIESIYCGEIDRFWELIENHTFRPCVIDNVFHNAVRRCYFEVVKFLTEKKNVSYEAANTAFHNIGVAYVPEQLPIVKYLLENYDISSNRISFVLGYAHKYNLHDVIKCINESQRESQHKKKEYSSQPLVHNNRFAFVGKGHVSYEYSAKYLINYNTTTKNKINEYFKECVLTQDMNIVDFDQDTKKQALGPVEKGTSNEGICFTSLKHIAITKLLTVINGRNTQ